MNDYDNLKPGEVTLFKCDNCFFGIFLPVVVGTEGFYNAISNMPSGYYTSSKWEFQRAIDDLKAEKISCVLDVGCGNGHFLSLLRAEMPHVRSVGQEVGGSAAAHALGEGHSVMIGDFPTVAMEKDDPARFDAICMFQVLEHVAQPLKFLKGAWQLLREGGLLIVAVPDSQGPVRYFKDSLTAIPPHHVSRWQSETFLKSAPNLGFQVEHIKFEPLPRYLWKSYLPVMLERDLLPTVIARYMNRSKITRRLIRLLDMTKLEWIPGLPGHSLYVLLRKMKVTSSEA